MPATNLPVGHYRPPRCGPPYRCPVCGGNGLVANGFYRQTSGMWSSTSTEPEKCRACDGKGYVR